MVAPGDGKPSCIVLSAICFLGIVSGILWAFTGYRGRSFLEKYFSMVKDIESDATVWKGGDKWKPATETVVFRQSLNCSCAGTSWVLLVGGRWQWRFCTWYWWLLPGDGALNKGLIAIEIKVRYFV